ncbi:MAG: YbaK/EbsC family protein [Candidatus Komeilibacteria bacterium]
MLKVISLLADRKIPYELIEFAEPAYTVDDVSRLAGEKLQGSVTVKTLILVGKKTAQPYCFILLGSDRLDTVKIKTLINEGYNLAKAATVEQVAQSEPGSVCPFLVNLPLYIDEKVFQQPTINVGSGDHHYGLNIASDTLKQLNFRAVTISC